MKKRFNQILAFLLAILMFTQSTPIATYASSTDAQNSSTGSLKSSRSSELDNWSIRLDFVDNDAGTLTENYTMTQDGIIYRSRQVTLQVTIQYTGDGTVTYAPEDVSFELADIRDIVAVQPDDDYTYDIAAELKGSNSGRGDWYYEVDGPYESYPGENIYTFTNKEKINGAFTSTFQILMEIYPLSCIPNFQKDLSTALSFKNLNGTVSSNNASFTYLGTKSTYEIIADYKEIEAGISDEIIGRLPAGTDTDDYIFADVQFIAPYVSNKIAKIYKAELSAAFPEDVIIGNHTSISSNGIFQNPIFNIDDSNKITVYGEGRNNYLFPEDEDTTCMNFYVAFPREKYMDLGTYDVTFNLSGAYFGEEDMITLDTTVLTFNFSEFNYVWEAGNLYLHQKFAYSTTNQDAYRDNKEHNYIYENMVYSYDGNRDKAFEHDFILSTTAIYTGQTFDVVVTDDLSYFIYEDNTYRKVEDDERYVTEMYIPAVEDVTAIKIYGRTAGSDTYELYKSYGPLSSQRTLTIDDKEYCDIQIKFVGLTNSIQKENIYIYFAYLSDDQRDNGKRPIKVYNFSYMDVLINGEPVTFDREEVSTNISGLDAEIDNYDKEKFGTIKYRATDYMSILDARAGVHQSRGSNSSYTGKTEVTEDRVSLWYGQSTHFYDFQGGGNTWCDFTDTLILPINWDVDIEDLGFYHSSYNNYYYFENGDECLLKGYFVTYNDLPEKLKSQITIEKTVLDDGRIQLKIHYDFRDNKLVNQSLYFNFFLPCFPIHMDRDTFEMLEMNGKRVDIDITRSIEQASNTTLFVKTSRDEYVALYCPTVAYSTYQGVQAESSINGDVFNNTDKVLNLGDSYEYKLMLYTGNSQAKYVTFYDTLDGAYNSNTHWQGTFAGVDTSDLEYLGATPKVYYSTSATQAHDLTASGWVLSTSYTGNLSNVKAIAVDLGDYVIGANSLALVRIKMQSPASVTSNSSAAYNNCSVDYKAYDSSLTNLTEENASETIIGLTSNTTKIGIENTEITVIYNANGGTGTGITDVVDVKETYTIKENPFSKPGYKFAGWDLTSTTPPSSTEFSENQKITDVLSSFDISEPTNETIVNLYAIWEPITYKIEYKGNGHTGGSTATSTHTYDVAKNLTTNGYTKTGYIFNGWNTQADGKGTSYTDKQSVKNLTTTNGAVITLYAQWTPIQYTIEYKGNGNTSGSTATSTHIYDVAKNLTTNGYSKTGYAFTGWNTQADGKGTSYTDEQSVKNLTTTNGAVITLYAQWTPNTNTKYTVKHWLQNVNGDATVKNDVNYTLKDTDNLFGTSDTTVTPAVKTYDGFTSPTPQSVTIKADGSLVVNYYYTRKSFTVTVNKGTGINSVSGGGTYLYGQEVTIDATLKDGYKWNNWTGTYDTTTKKYTFAMPAANVSETANAVPITYTIEYKGNGNTGGSTLTSTHTYDVAKNLTDNGYTKTGYVFTGWNTTADGKGTSYTDEQSVKNLTTTDGDVITLYAQWTPIQYTIEYKENGSTSGSTATSTHIYDVAKNLTENGFEKVGYTFNGWNTQADGKGKSYADEQEVINLTTKNGDIITLYAQWSPIQYTIEYKGNGSTSGSTATSTHIYDVAKNLTENGFEKIGHTFKGWNTQADGKGKSYADEQKVINLTTKNGDIITLYAQWTPNVYDIIYELDGGENHPDNPDEYTYGEGVDKFKEPTKDDHKFMGWYEDPEFTKPIDSIEPDRTGDVTIYAKWDKKPEISVTPEPGTEGTEDETGSVLIFYEGQIVTKEMLLENVTAEDKEDGDITDKIRIVKIVYSEGKLVDEIKQPSYSVEWENDMPESETLDTWFLQLDKKDSPVTHKITYEVTDSAGNTTDLEWIIKVKYNEFPEITGTNEYYFTLEEVKNGAITEKAFLEDLLANGSLQVTDKEDDVWYPGTISKKLKITDFYAEQFENITGPGFVVLHYSVIDSLGKESFFEIKVLIVVDGYISDGSGEAQVRFIDEVNYKKNMDYATQQLSEEEKTVLNHNGGLNVRSKWYLNEAFSSVILPVLELASQKNPEPLYSYFYKKSDVKEIQETFTYGNETDYDKIYEFLADFIEKWL